MCDCGVRFGDFGILCMGGRGGSWSDYDCCCCCGLRRR